ncbi:hypothetical protein [Spirosoma pollinicola]|uniref:Uncharacterized protein n=1 Tax=Spirosoma pollinicola TaxID=2057025 RepID=A0A2K8ZAU1_9BACT|nr:hypothetical protein [Spirosoma pollinicola]AUD06993.1 hypothetical protein CWM47_37350 [Spirosoma pollinicola]
MDYKYLYRALRRAEIEAGYKLIPKGTMEFVAEPRLDLDVFPMVFGSETNAIRHHQWKQNGFTTRGISATPHYERALFYAKRNKVVVRIDTEHFQSLGIRTFDVNESLRERPHEIAVPEDDEIILVYEKDGEFPAQIITDVTHID